MIVGINGKSRSGKDTIADVFVAKFDFVKIAFADAVKRDLARLFGFSREQLWGDKKNEIDPRYGKTPRQFMTAYGTDFARAHDPEVWIRRMADTAKSLFHCFAYVPEHGVIGASIGRNRDRIIIPDCRYENELLACDIRIRVVRRGTAPGEHSSETDMDQFPPSLFDHELDNNGTKEQIEQRAERVAKDIIHDYQFHRRIIP